MQAALGYGEDNAHQICRSCCASLLWPFCGLQFSQLCTNLSTSKRTQVMCLAQILLLDGYGLSQGCSLS